MTPLLENILQQPVSLEAVVRHHTVEGRHELEAAAELLGKHRRVIVTGMGASLFAGVGFAYALGAKGFHAQAIEASEILYFLEREVDADTVLVPVSRSGESVEIVKLAQALRGRAAATVGMMNVPESTLAKNVDRPLLLASPSDEFVAVQTYTATLGVFALLDAAIGGELDTRAQQLIETAGVLSHWIPECVAARQSWDTFLNSTGPFYILGRGPGLGSVAEGVLLMHEVAKWPAVGMSVAQFRHGPVEVVDRGFHAVVLGTQSETATLDAAFANDVAAMDGAVRWLGPSVPGCDIPLLCAWPPDVPALSWPFFETVALQCLAYRKAELTGIRPGKFRWAPQVTTAESGFAPPRPQH